MAKWPAVPYGRYLAREEVLSVALDVTEMPLEAFAGDVKLGSMPPDPLVWHRSFTSSISIIVT